jgi:uncharacterized protein
MARGKTTAFQTSAFATMLVVVAGFVTCGPALAQYWGDSSSGGWGGWGGRSSGSWGGRYPSDRYYRRSPSRDFFYPFTGERHNRPAPAVDYSKAPPPRKLETPPRQTVVVIGDSMADWLGYGLDENYSDQPEIGVERKIRPTSGLVRYDSKDEALDWPQAAKNALSNEKPDAIVVMLGVNDRVPLGEKAPAQPKRNGEPAQGANQSPTPASPDQAAAPADAEASPQTAAHTDSQRPVPGRSYDFHTDQWAALYAKRIDAMIAALKSKGVLVIWVGLPAIRGAKASDDVSYLDELYREHAERAGVIYIDIWGGFVDEDGDYAAEGPDFKGQTRRLRTADGVYFTKAGAVKLASYVDRELRRMIPSSVAPVALPGPETTPKSGSVSARPDVGPVLPLNSGTSDHNSELLGGKDHTTQTTSDSTAAKVLSRGETLAAPAGRADDFSWPRKDVIARPKGSPEPVAAAASTPENQSPATKGDGKNQADAKKDAKEKSKIGSHVSAQEPVAAVASTPENQGAATKGDGKNQTDAKKDAKEKSKMGSDVSARVSHHYYNYYSGRQDGSYHGDFSSRRDELTSGAR